MKLGKSYTMVFATKSKKGNELVKIKIQHPKDDLVRKDVLEVMNYLVTKEVFVDKMNNPVNRVVDVLVTELKAL